MAKEDFCFTFYDGDATRDMSHMNRLERGCYTDIIISIRKFGHLSLDQIKKVLSKDFDECFSAIELVLLKDDEGKFFIEWLEKSLQKSKRNKEFQETSVYIIELSNDHEEFIKIGISNNVNKRLADYVRAGFRVSIIKCMLFERRSDAEFQESLLHDKYISLSYTPIKRFAGETECFLKKIKNYL